MEEFAGRARPNAEVSAAPDDCGREPRGQSAKLMSKLLFLAVAALALFRA